MRLHELQTLSYIGAAVAVVLTAVLAANLQNTPSRRLFADRTLVAEWQKSDTGCGSTLPDQSADYFFATSSAFREVQPSGEVWAKDPNKAGWLFQIPRKPETPAEREHAAFVTNLARWGPWADTTQNWQDLLHSSLVPTNLLRFSFRQCDGYESRAVLGMLPVTGYGDLARAFLTLEQQAIGGQPQLVVRVLARRGRQAVELSGKFGTVAYDPSVKKGYWETAKDASRAVFVGSSTLIEDTPAYLAVLQQQLRSDPTLAERAWPVLAELLKEFALRD